jgi:hypothetical protein
MSADVFAAVNTQQSHWARAEHKSCGTHSINTHTGQRDRLQVHANGKRDQKNREA